MGICYASCAELPQTRWRTDPCPSREEGREDILAKPRDNRQTLSDTDFQDPAERLMFTRGIFEHPGGAFHGPLAEGGLEVAGVDGPRLQAISISTAA
eukprot:5080542-Pyramimonas_sp.AAC.1